MKRHHYRTVAIKDLRCMLPHAGVGLIRTGFYFIDVQVGLVRCGATLGLKPLKMKQTVSLCWNPREQANREVEKDQILAPCLLDV